MRRGPFQSSRRALLLAPLLYFVPETSLARHRGGGGSRSVQYSHKGAAIAILMIGAIALFGWLDNRLQPPGTSNKSKHPPRAVHSKYRRRNMRDSGK